MLMKRNEERQKQIEPWPGKQIQVGNRPHELERAGPRLGVGEEWKTLGGTDRHRDGKHELENSLVADEDKPQNKNQSEALGGRTEEKENQQGGNQLWEKGQPIQNVKTDFFIEIQQDYNEFTKDIVLPPILFIGMKNEFLAHS
jgi:hypothetical protein